MDEPYEGCELVTRENLTKYMIENFGWSPEQVEEAITRYHDQLTNGQKFGSHAFFVGEAIFNLWHKERTGETTEYKTITQNRDHTDSQLDIERLRAEEP